LLVAFTGSAQFFIRNPQRAAEVLISPGSIYTPEELFTRLSPESAWVLYQHNAPLWRPLENVKTPMLCLAGEIDATISLENERISADHYGADFVVIPEAAHNLMMEHNYRETAETIHNWLSKHQIV